MAETDDGSSQITLTGRDRPGLTAEIAELFARASARVLHFEQTVTQGQLTSHWRIELEDAPLEPLLRQARGLALHVEHHRPARAAPAPRTRWAVTLLQTELTSQAIAGATRAITNRGFDVQSVAPLSSGALSVVEMILEGDAEATDLQADLLALSAQEGVDVVLQPEGPLRRSKRLVVMDMDSTLIQQEVIDELARAAGAFDRVAAITARAMNGEIGFDESLRARVKALAGVPTTVFAEVLDRIELTPGAEDLFGVLARLGYRTAVVSGGFLEVVEPMRQRLGLDYAFANRLEVKDGRLTGGLLGEIVNREKKAVLLEQLAAKEHISLDQVIAVGDGANDLDMLARAGLGIAFNAKPAVQAQAKCALNQPRLDAILYLLGIREDEARRLLRGSASTARGA